VCCFVSFVCQSIGEVPPPPIHATDNSTFTFYFKYFLRTLKYVLPPVLFTLTQVVLLLITFTFTRVQIQSNLGTADSVRMHALFTIVFCRRSKTQNRSP
jgi:hypothetical protein